MTSDSNSRTKATPMPELEWLRVKGRVHIMHYPFVRFLAHRSMEIKERLACAYLLSSLVAKLREHSIPVLCGSQLAERMLRDYGKPTRLRILTMEQLGKSSNPLKRLNNVINECYTKRAGLVKKRERSAVNEGVAWELLSAEVVMPYAPRITDFFGDLSK